MIHGLVNLIRIGFIQKLASILSYIIVNISICDLKDKYGETWKPEPVESI
jgi:hypothetical protein